MKKTLMMFAMFLTAMALSFSSVQAAENQDESVQTYRIQLFDEPQSIKLPKADTSYWFTVPAATEVEKAMLSLILKTSDTLLEDYSTATVELNGVAVASISLQDLAELPDMKWDVELPVELLKTDGSMNQLSVVTAQRSILGDCADIDNPANWVIISDKSALMLSLKRTKEFVLSDLYPFVFNRAELGNSISTRMIMAGADEEAEGSAALTIASSIGANFPYKDIDNLTVGKSEEDADSIFEINADSKSDPALKEGEGYLGIGSDEPVKVKVAGGGSEGLKKAVGMLTDPDMLSQFDEPGTTIASMHEGGKNSLAARGDGLYVLRDFGYDNINLAGAFHQQTFFTIRQPDGILGGPGSYFEVHFRHSDALISDTSLLTVFFDGVPATSVQLSGTNVDDGKLRVKIPKESLSKGSFEISIDVYNYLGKIDCSKDWYDVAWTLIDRDSVIYLEPSDNTVTPSLARFPSMWGGDTVACIPQGSSDALMQSLVAFAARNGQNTKLMTEFNLKHAIAEGDVSDSNIVIAGERGSINIPAKIADELFIVPSKDGYTISDKVDTVPEVLADKVIIQAVRSPYNFRRIVYVITWSGAEGEKYFSDLMVDKDRLNSLDGQVALAGARSVVSLESEGSREEAIPLSPQVITAKIVRVTGIPLAGLVIILILVIVIIALIVRQVKAKNRFDDAKVKVEQENKEIREEFDSENNEEKSDGDSDEEDPDDFDRN
ncbi:MAG: cellulose biosynthesis cyclic di-GMP-binding regulatory protein BcsB [Lachnospiraceae bacterium]|nr:cellulose biosynthesis cyclic di-GMP-binding regulatory protein BcsB [Lachnospiraceae bacterium]